MEGKPPPVLRTAGIVVVSTNGIVVSTMGAVAVVVVGAFSVTIGAVMPVEGVCCWVVLSIANEDPGSEESVMMMMKKVCSFLRSNFCFYSNLSNNKAL
jgi:hypothetical protein